MTTMTENSLDGLRTTLHLVSELVGEIHKREAQGEDLGRIGEIAISLDNLADVASLPDALQNAYGAISSALAGVSLRLQGMVAHDHLRGTHEKLSEVSAATENAALGMMDGLDRAMTKINSLHAMTVGAGGDDGDDKEFAGVVGEVREEIGAMFNLLQFQDITSQQIQGIAALIKDAETTLGGASKMFGVTQEEKLPDPDEYNADATMGNAADRQRIIDETINAARA